MATPTVTLTPSVSICRDGATLARGENDDCVRDGTAEKTPTCITVQSNHKDTCITWSTPKKSIDVCVDILPFQSTACDNYTDRPDLKIIEVNGEAPTPDEDGTIYVCENSTVLIQIEDYNPDFEYSFLSTSMDVFHDTPSDYATFNGDGTITVVTQELLEGATESVWIHAYDPFAPNDCVSEAGTAEWENAGKAPTPIFEDQIKVSDRVYKFPVMNSQSYPDGDAIFELDPVPDDMTYDYTYLDGVYYLTITLGTSYARNYSGTLYAKAKVTNKCFSNRGSFIVQASGSKSLSSITYHDFAIDLQDVITVTGYLGWYCKLHLEAKVRGRLTFSDASYIDNPVTIPLDNVLNNFTVSGVLGDGSFSAGISEGQLFGETSNASYSGEEWQGMFGEGTFQCVHEEAIFKYGKAYNTNSGVILVLSSITHRQQLVNALYDAFTQWPYPWVEDTYHSCLTSFPEERLRFANPTWFRDTAPCTFPRAGWGAVVFDADMTVAEFTWVMAEMYADYLMQYIDEQ